MKRNFLNKVVLSILGSGVLAATMFTAAISPETVFPEADITNGIVKAKLYLPDMNNGYYQGTRFDWSGVIPSLEYKGHSYFGKWFDVYDPKIHDAISGPVEEFVALDFADTKAGSDFVKIGVGVLKKPDDKPYSFATNYEVVNQGKRTVKRKSDIVEFTHELTDETGYGYVYTKIVKLTKGKPELVLEHSLKNTGKKAISTSVYDHNFFMIDNEPTGPGMKITFPFEVGAEGKGFGSIADVEGKSIIYNRALEKKENVFSAGLKGLTSSPKDYDLTIENVKTGAGVRITGDQPIDKLVYWSCPTTACPEPYIKLNVEPGKEVKWKISYKFFTAAKN
jgi:hypothetical protein